MLVAAISATMSRPVRRARVRDEINATGINFRPPAGRAELPPSPVTIWAARSIVREQDATGTHMLGRPRKGIGAQVLLVLAVATIVLLIVFIAHIMKVQMKEKPTAMEIANGIVIGFWVVNVRLNE